MDSVLRAEFYLPLDGEDIVVQLSMSGWSKKKKKKRNTSLKMQKYAEICNISHPSLGQYSWQNRHLFCSRNDSKERKKKLIKKVTLSLCEMTDDVLEREEVVDTDNTEKQLVCVISQSRDGDKHPGNYRLTVSY